MPLTATPVSSLPSQRLVASLHDLLQYLFAYVRLGSNQARHGGEGSRKFSGNWGGTEGIGKWPSWRMFWDITCQALKHLAFNSFDLCLFLSGAELQQLQSEIGRLGDPSDPTQVVEYLTTRCRALYLEHNITVEHYLHRTLLLTGNKAATQVEIIISLQSSSVFRNRGEIPKPLSKIIHW